MLDTILSYKTELIIAVTIGLLYLVWKIFVQVRATYQHLDDKVLSDFWKGRLKATPHRQRQVANHLVHCESCREKLNEIQQTTRPDPGKIISRRF